MNIFDKGFTPSEAVIRYLDGDYVVLRPGSFVRCAITGKPIPIDELIYWNVDRQEPYADAAAAARGLPALRARPGVSAAPERPRGLLFISNGHGEDSIAAEIVRRLPPAASSKPSRDRRRQRLRGACPIVGPRANVPVRGLAQRQGLAPPRHRWRRPHTIPPAVSFLRGIRRSRYARTIVVGDMVGIYLCLAAGLRDVSMSTSTRPASAVRLFRHRQERPPQSGENRVLPP